MNRREFITLIGGGVAAWPLAARAQQPAMPVIGFLSVASPETWAPNVAAFKNGLRQTGFVEGQNVTIEYRWSYDDYSRLPAFAADLVGLRVSVIAASGGSRSDITACRPSRPMAPRPRRRISDLCHCQRASTIVAAIE